MDEQILKPVIQPTKSPTSGSHTPLAFDATLPLEQGLPARRGDPEFVLCHRRGPERSSDPLASDLPRAANEANTLMTPRVPELPNYSPAL
jgi:hypothetical protein